MHNVSSVSYNMWQYIAFVMDSVSSDQANIPSSFIHAYIYYLYAPFIHCVPHHPNLVSFLFIPSLYYLFQRIFHLLVYNNYMYRMIIYHIRTCMHSACIWRRPESTLVDLTKFRSTRQLRNTSAGSGLPKKLGST